MAVEILRVPSDAHLIFEHPSGKRLVVNTGAEQIQWQYTLNTSSQSTYGGQVVQVLSTFAGPLMIQGRTADNEELKRIYDYFRAMMTRAGYQHRDERAILFKYPERGWSFHIQVTNLENFRYAYNEIAQPWAITAEIVSDKGLDALSAHTMSTFTESLTHEYLHDVGFKTKGDPRIDPNYNKKASFENFGDNFNRLLGAWSTGDFAHWGFDALADPSNQFDKTSREYWMQIFGSEYVAGGALGGGTGDPTVVLGGESPTTKDGIVTLLNSVFEAKNIPGRLGVAVAIVESGLDPNRKQDGCNSANCGIGMFQVNGDGSGRGGNGPNAAAIKAAGKDRNNIAQHYTSQMQIADAADWFKSFKPDSNINPNNLIQMANWAQKAQAAGCAYNAPCGLPKFTAALIEADRLIAQSKAGSVVRSNVVRFANQTISQAGTKHYSQGAGRLQIPETKGQLWSTDCSGWVTGLYYWGTDGNKDFNPNGSGKDYRSGGFTGTIVHSSNGKTITKSQVKAGDLIVYGSGDGHHVNIILEDYHGDSTKIAGFGSEGGPRKYTLADNGQFDSVVTYRSFLP